MLNLTITRVLDSPGRAPAGIAWDGGYLWHNDYESGRLYQLDIASGQVVTSILSAGVISGLTWDGRSLWQSRLDENWLQRLNPAKEDIDQTLQFEDHHRLSDLTWDGKQLWMLSQSRGQILAINEESGQVVRTLPVPVASTAFAFSKGTFWLTYPAFMNYDPATDSFDWLDEERHYYVAQIDPLNGNIIAKIELNFLPMGIEWVTSNLWLSHPAAGHLYEYEVMGFNDR